jgi:hypothetical protein
MRSTLLLDERIKPDGTHARTWATSEDGRVRITDDDGMSGEISVVALDRVMCRYGRPLDHAIVVAGDALACGGYRLRRLRHHAVVDAEGRDYLVWERPDGEPLACVATMATAALRHLCARLGTDPSSGI